MGLFFHELKASKSVEQPRNWIVFDCETRSVRADPLTQELTLRLGVALYRRDGRANNPARESRLHFTTPGQFWDWAISQSERDRQLWIVAYNASVDWRWVDGFRQLDDRGYTMRSPWIKHPIMILKYEKDDHKIVIIDAMNWVEGKLSDWGERLGLPKLDMPAESEPDSVWFRYCDRDVDVLDGVVNLWRSWVRENDMGPISATKAGQAMTAFRHRFMKRPIMIHAHDGATAAERASYHGGRVECFRVGRYENGPFYKLDINSMYPAVMHDDPMPTEFLQRLQDVSVARIKKGLRKYLFVALCELKTNEPAYAIQSERGLIYPTGTFTTWLTTPHIRYAIERKHLVHCHDVYIYDGGVIFDKWVKEFYAKRMAFRAEGDKAREEVVKKMLNSLYGKWAQRGEKCTEVDNVDGDPDGTYILTDADEGRKMRYSVICGHRFDYEEEGEAANSFTAIASHVTAGCGLRLWKYAKLAGASHRYYCDTDSLIVDTVGYKRLKKYIDPERLGFLKVEEISPFVEIHTLKDYATEKVTKHKGVSKGAIEIIPGVFRQEQWQGLRGAIADGTTDRVKIRQVCKALQRDYKKGRVLHDGRVVPLVVEDGRVVGLDA